MYFRPEIKENIIRNGLETVHLKNLSQSFKITDIKTDLFIFQLNTIQKELERCLRCRCQN